MLLLDNLSFGNSLGQNRYGELCTDSRFSHGAFSRDFFPTFTFQAEMERMESKLKNDTEIAHFKRDYDFKKAGYDVEVNTAKASADLAYTLQAALMTQQIKEQETQVKVIERRQEIELQEQEIQRKEKELDSKVRKPAEAEKYMLETLAEAARQKAVLEAEAEAEAIALKVNKQIYDVSQCIIGGRL